MFWIGYVDGKNAPGRADVDDVTGGGHGVGYPTRDVEAEPAPVFRRTGIGDVEDREGAVSPEFVAKSEVETTSLARHAVHGLGEGQLAQRWQRARVRGIENEEPRREVGEVGSRSGNGDRLSSHPPRLADEGG
jgi:hypothetical protein